MTLLFHYSFSRPLLSPSPSRFFGLFTPSQDGLSTFDFLKRSHKFVNVVATKHQVASAWNRHWPDRVAADQLA
jgi:hypothetical protein